MYAKDGIHFNNLGKRSLVRKIKAHLNPHLGLKDYNHYEAPLERPKQIRSENNRQSWTSSGWGHIRPKFERPRQQTGEKPCASTARRTASHCVKLLCDTVVYYSCENEHS